jgi:membrane associated rhomboid family serine protease/uncharacterized protein (DUF2249 family)
MPSTSPDQKIAIADFLRNPPRTTLGLCLALGLIFTLWHGADLRLQKKLDDFYISQLLAVEWPNYDPYLRQHRQTPLANQLGALYDKKDFASLARQTGADQDFVLSVQNSTFLDADTKARWAADRRSYDPDHNRLSAFALGLNPQQFRPITFLTYQLVPQLLPGLLANLLLLLVCGSLLERSLGGGIVLAAYVGGGIIGGLLFLVLNSHSVFPLATASVGTAAVVALFTMQMRGQELSLPGLGRPLRHAGWIMAALWLGKEGGELFVEHLPWTILLPHLAGFGSGVLVWLGYQRWFVNRALAEIVEVEADVDELYRGRLDQAMKAIGKLSFGEAKQLLRELVDHYPQDLRALVQLYHLEKLKPDSTEFEVVARRVFTASNTDEAAQACLTVYRDYSRLTESRLALDTDTSLKLIMRFARLGELKEADKLMRAVLASHEKHGLLAKTANTLAQAYGKLNDNSQAAFYRDLASKNIGSA